MIGDPKQSIYAFRGADIHTYLTARADAGGLPYTLGKNYRSTDGLVAAVNQVFSFGAAHPDGAFLFQDRIPYTAVAAEGRSDRFLVDGQPVTAMTFWVVQQDAPMNKTGDTGYTRRMADATADEIVRWLTLAEEKPPRAGFEMPDGGLRMLRPADIAILVRTRDDGRVIRQALDRRRVRSVYLSDKDSVFDTLEAKDLLYLLRACAEPEQESMLRTALATGVVALPFDMLDRLAYDEDAWEEKITQFRQFRDIWRSQGVLPMLRLLLQTFHIPARLLNLAGGERTLTNLLHLSELLQTASVALHGEQALIRWLAEQLEQPETGDQDEQILRLESDEDLIRVVTIHKSKGLEYPVVFLPFICGYRKVTEKNTLVAALHDADGRRRLVLKPEKDDLAIADRERLAEDLRILYVAMTRAKYACCLGTAVLGSTNTPDLSAMGYLLAAGNTIAPTALPQKLADLKGNCPHIDILPLPEVSRSIYVSTAQAPVLTAARTFTGEIPDDWWIASYSKMVKGAHTDVSEAPVAADETIDVLPSADVSRASAGLLPNSAREDHLLEMIAESAESTPTKETGLSIHGFFRGAEPGSFLHGILEWAAREGFSDLISRPKDELERVKDILMKINDLCHRRDWGDWSLVLTDWLQKLLHTPIRLHETSSEMMLGELSRSDCLPEMEFLLAGHGVSIRYIDAAVNEHVLPKSARPRLQENTLNGMLTGFIDLVFCHENRYYVLDYKSNHLGADENAYTREAMQKAILEHRYDIQYVLYTLALHRHLKHRLPNYEYDRHIGGAVYLFLRGVDDQGNGVFLDRPPQRLIESLDRAFAGKEARHAD